MEYESTTFCQSDLMNVSFAAFEDMRKKEELCDLTIKVGNLSFTTHRVILAAGIPYFRSLFTSNRMESERREIVMGDIDPKAFESLIDFAYTSKVNISVENAQSLFLASEFLQLIQVKKACIEFMSKSLHFGNVVKVRAFAHALNISNLMDRSRLYILQNFEEFSRCNEFLNLDGVFVKEIVSKDDLHVSSEETVSKAIMNWVKASPSDRQHILPELLSEVRMIYLPLGHLVKCLASEELVRASVACRDIIEDVKTYHLLPEEELPVLNLKTQRRKKVQIHAVCYSDTTGYSVYQCDLLNEAWNRLRPVLKFKEADATGIWSVAVANESLYIFLEKTAGKFNLRTEEWEVLDLGDEDIRGGVVLSHGNMIYCFGSCFAGSEDRMLCFNPEIKRWIPEAKMSVWHGMNPAAASLEEFIYVTGGWNTRDGRRLRSSEKYHPLSGEWSEIAQMLYSRDRHGSTAMNKKIYVCGGRTQKDFARTAEVYDPVTNQWKSISSMKTGRCLFSLLSHNDRIYAIGGDGNYDRKTVLKTEIYDPDSGQWKNNFCAPEGFLHAIVAEINIY